VQRKTMLPGPVMCLLDGRIEKRVPMMVAASLVSFQEQMVTEEVLTENVSPHGARVDFFAWVWSLESAWPRPAIGTQICTG
jgi:hypothetical protein